MALVHCRECGKRISDTATACPKCGAKQYGRKGSGEKDRTTAALLALFLGGAGIHWFYLGNSKKGILYLIFVWTFIPAILALIDAIKFFCMSDAEFKSKYC